MQGMMYDVVVIGGGSAGVAAAVGAAKVGANTLLIDENGYLGGMATRSSVLTYCGFFTRSDSPEQIVAGAGQLVLDKLKGLGISLEPIRTHRTRNVIYVLDPEAVKLALDYVVEENRVNLMLHTRFMKASVKDGRIEEIIVSDRERIFSISGSAFVDASGDAALVYSAGGVVRIGDGRGNFQAATQVMRIGGVSPTANIHPDVIAKAIKQGREAGIYPLRKEIGTLVRLPISNDVLALLVEVETDGTSAESLTTAELESRRQAWAYLEALRLYADGFKHAYLVSTGPVLGVRETRHVVGEYMLTADDVIGAARFSTSIGRGGWPVELHSDIGGLTEWRPISGDGYYEIPFETLRIPNLENVVSAGRIISSDPIAYGSIRVMGTSFVTGHAAGIAAAVYAQTRHWSITQIREELIRQGAIV